MMLDSPGQRKKVARRGTNLVLIAIIALAFIGFFVGIDYGVPQHDTDLPTSALASDSTTVESGDILPATTYADIRQWREEQRSEQAAVLEYLIEETPSYDSEYWASFTPDPDDKRQSLQLRSERRAYNGAPPIIPHAVDQLGHDSCLACHGKGFKLENRTAKQLPHPYLENCMQCHAPPSPGIFDSVPFRENTFVGIAAPFEGARAWPGAPPVVPHTTWMRNNCLACHGPNSWPGMETTHPWRQNCLQCHAPSSVLDLNPSTLTQFDLLPPPEVNKNE